MYVCIYIYSHTFIYECAYAYLSYIYYGYIFTCSVQVFMYIYHTFDICTYIVYAYIYAICVHIYSGIWLKIHNESIHYECMTYIQYMYIHTFSCIRLFVSLVARVFTVKSYLDLREYLLRCICVRVCICVYIIQVLCICIQRYEMIRGFSGTWIYFCIQHKCMYVYTHIHSCTCVRMCACNKRIGW